MTTNVWFNKNITIIDQNRNSIIKDLLEINKYFKIIHYLLCNKSNKYIELNLSEFNFSYQITNNEFKNYTNTCEYYKEQLLSNIINFKIKYDIWTPIINIYNSLELSEDLKMFLPDIENKINEYKINLEFINNIDRFFEEILIFNINYYKLFESFEIIILLEIRQLCATHKKILELNDINSNEQISINKVNIFINIPENILSKLINNGLILDKLSILFSNNVIPPICSKYKTINCNTKSSQCIFKWKCLYISSLDPINIMDIDIFRYLSWFIHCYSLKFCNYYNCTNKSCKFVHVKSILTTLETDFSLCSYENSNCSLWITSILLQYKKIEKRRVKYV